MVVYINKLITSQHIRTHISTSKHVTLSQAMTHSNKSHNGPRNNNHKLCHKIDPKQATTTGLEQSQAHPREAYLRLGEVVHLGKQQPHLGGLEGPIFLSSGSPKHTCLRPRGPLPIGEPSLRLGEEPIFLEDIHTNKTLNEKPSFPGPNMESKPR